jgi:hypothetical protein
MSAASGVWALRRNDSSCYSPEEIEALARALSDGAHRESARRGFEIAEDAQDAELVRVAAYAGLRLGELLALRWRDVDFAGHPMTISRAISRGTESSTKSGRMRRVPLPDQAAAVLDRLSRRGDYTSAEDRVFCNVFGPPLDASALRRRFKKARDAVGLRVLRFHDCDTPTARCWRPAGSISSRFRRRWATVPSQPPAATSTRGRRRSRPRSSPESFRQLQASCTLSTLSGNTAGSVLEPSDSACRVWRCSSSRPRAGGVAVGARSWLVFLIDLTVHRRIDPIRQPICQAKAIRDARQQNRPRARGQAKAVRHDIYGPKRPTSIAFKVNLLSGLIAVLAAAISPPRRLFKTSHPRAPAQLVTNRG